MPDNVAANDVIDVNGIMRLIPHRHPFLMVERIVDFVAYEKAVGIKNVSIGEPFFQGHFPQQPIMPGVLIIESMAQTAACLVVLSLGPESEGKLVYFMSVDEAKFRRPVEPGDQLHVHVAKKHFRGPVWKFYGEAKVDNQTVAEATFAAMIRDS